MLTARQSDEEILAAHREFYGARKEAAPPKVRNAASITALCEPRAARWRGHAYTVPPVPFRDGWALFVVAQVLASGSPAAQDRALVTGRRILCRLIGARWRSPFRRATAADLAGLIDTILDVPDDSPPRLGHAPRVVDLRSGFFAFAERFPALMRDGLPVSWAAYQCGLREIGRSMAVEELRMAQAARVAQAGKDDWLRYAGELRRHADVA
jgi:hypothetical protein